MELFIEDRDRIDYYSLRPQLVAAGHKFDDYFLRKIPYHQLQLCCTGNSGPAICSVDLVTYEKQSRRQRFLGLELEEFNKAKIYLQTEGMYEDVLQDLNRQSAPHWDSLTKRQQIWAKLNCIWSHLDNVLPRLRETYRLVFECSMAGTLPGDVCVYYMGRLDDLSLAARHLADNTMRNQIEDLRDSLQDFLPDAERSICQREQIDGFICTSDCFKI